VHHYLYFAPLGRSFYEGDKLITLNETDLDDTAPTLVAQTFSYAENQVAGATVASVVASIERARRHINPHVELLGIVACRVNPTGHVRDVVARLRARFGAIVLEHTVREAIRIAEAPALHLPITAYAPSSPVANDYRAVAAELLDRLGDLSSS
jgi:cellulose biosynthesis protein BcsQ